MKKNKLIVAVLIILMSTLVSANEKHNWQRFSGKWVVENSRVTETNAWPATWNYYELINNNSLVSIQDFTGYSSIEFTIELFDRVKSPAEVLISFGVRSEYKNWLYHMYAFKISGGFWGINKVSLIHSDMKDKSLPYATKGNIFIDELASEKFCMKYKRKYDCRIDISGNEAALFIEGEKVLTGTLPSDNYKGRIAFSSKNTKLAIDNVRVKKGDKIVFEDNFDKDSIYVRTVQARVVRSSDAEAEDPAAEEVNNKN